MKAIRIFKRNIRDGIKSVGRNLSLSIASISCITITLLIVAIALIASSNIENITKVVRDDFTIVAFLTVLLVVVLFTSDLEVSSWLIKPYATPTESIAIITSNMITLLSFKISIYNIL